MPNLAKCNEGIIMKKGVITGSSTPSAIIYDRWIRGKVKIEFRPWSFRQNNDLEIAQECAALFTKRTGKKNLLGSVRQNFEEIVPFLLAEIRKRTPKL